MNGLRSAVLRVSGGRAVTLGNHIFLPSGQSQDVPTLAHEMTHANDYQVLAAAMGAGKGSVAYAAVAGVDRVSEMTGGNPYALPGQLTSSRPWGSYGFEQRAQIVEDCFGGRPDRCAVSPFRP